MPNIRQITTIPGQRFIQGIGPNQRNVKGRLSGTHHLFKAVGKNPIVCLHDLAILAPGRNLA
jgi:hypothetical protein